MSRREPEFTLEEAVDFAFLNEEQSGHDPFAMSKDTAEVYADQYGYSYGEFLGELRRRGWDERDALENPEPDETELDYEYDQWIPAAAVRFNEDGTVSLLERESNPRYADVVKYWASGDYMYGAVRESFPAPGTAHLLVGRSELPVARLRSAGMDAEGKSQFVVDRWVRRDERFPEPIRGFNRGRRRNAVSQVVQTLHQQLLDQGIHDEVRGRLNFVAWDENTLKVSRGQDGVLISYDRGRDLYDVDQYHGTEREPLREGVYADSLMDVIVPVLAGGRRR